MIHWLPNFWASQGRRRPQDRFFVVGFSKSDDGLLTEETEIEAEDRAGAIQAARDLGRVVGGALALRDTGRERHVLASFGAVWD